MMGNVMGEGLWEKIIDSGVVVPLYGNGYVYPEQRSWKDNNIGEKGRGKGVKWLWERGMIS